LVSEALTEEYFIVQVIVKPGNAIEIVIDGNNGVNIQKCVEISRQVENKLDRETEDFELSVLSAGLSNPFLVHRQYLKNIGKKVEVKLRDENVVTGILTQVDSEGFNIETFELEKIEGKNKKVEVVKAQYYSFASKPEVRNSISFK